MAGERIASIRPNACTIDDVKTTTLFDVLKDRRCFIVCRAVAGNDGKTDKKPTHPTGGYDIDGQDPANWLLPYEALDYANRLNVDKPSGVIEYGIGIVLSPDSGIFCIDLDHCRDLQTSGWLPHVANFESRFPGAYIEVSRSHRGKHFFGSYTGIAPLHGTKNKLYRMECYTEKRFIWITGDDAQGDILKDFTAEFLRFVAEFFPTHTQSDHGVEWTEGPALPWEYPITDEELLERAMRSVSAKGTFGNGIVFKALWEGDAEVLSHNYPSQNDHSAWDESSAEQALANYLAFWTRNDCARMLALMQRCDGLRRDKWDRPDYLRRTILKACATQTEWYTPPKVPVPPASIPESSPTTVKAPSPPIDIAPGDLPEVDSVVGPSIIAQYFAKMCWVRDINAIQLHDGTTADKSQFDTLYAGPVYAVTWDGQMIKSAWDAFTGSQIQRFPRAVTQFFDPKLPTGALRKVDDIDQVNSYQAVHIRRIKGDPAPFLDLINRMLPRGDDALILLSYMAACIQYLGVKFMWCPFIQGTKGNGKTTIGRIMEYCISERYAHWAKSDQMGEKFNSYLIGRLLILIDELYNEDKRELEETLKTVVTSTRMEIRPMHGEKRMRDILCNLMLFSNHKNGIRIDADERRYAALFCAQQSKLDKIRDGMTREYFIALNDWLRVDGFAIVFDYLSTFEIPDKYNPAALCNEAPVTTSTDEAASASLGSVEQEILDAIRQEFEGFRGGWISSIAVDHLVIRVGKERAIPRSIRASMIQSLGYIPHPSLPDGGLCETQIEGLKPRLYIKRGHTWAVDYLTINQVRQGFIDAQKDS